MKKIFLGIAIVFSCQSIFADEQTYKNREPQRKQSASALSKVTASTVSRMNAESKGGSALDRVVNATLSTSTTVDDGSKATAGGSVTKPVDAKATASTMAKRLEKAKALGKASLPSFLGSAALTALVQGVGWIIEEGGEVKRIPNLQNEDGTVNEHDQYAYSCSLVGYWACVDKNFNSMQAIGNAMASSNYDSVTSCQMVSSDIGTCQSEKVESRQYTFYKKSNPIYVADAPEPDSVPVSEQELADKIENYIINNDNSITNNIINNAYTYDSSNGASVSDDSNNLAVDNYKDIASAVDQASTSPYDPNRPKKGYYMITDGEKTVEGWVDASPSSGSSTSDTTSTTTNPDGSTSTETGSSTSDFTLPAFCDWASVICDWIGWTKEEPELEDEPLKIDEQNPLAFEHVDHVTFGQRCPFVKEIVALPMGVLGDMSFEKDLTFICDWGLDAKPFIISAGSLGALIFLLYGIRNGNV